MNGQHRRDLGWKQTASGYAQPRFYLGRDKYAAAIAVTRLEKLWHDIEKQWERDRPTPRPVWDENTLAMAKSIINGEQVTFIKPPMPTELLGKLRETELHGVRFAKMVRDFPGRNLQLDEPVLKQEIADLAAAYQEKAEML